MNLKKYCATVALVGATFASGNVFGQAEIVPEEKLETATEEDVVGWNPALSGNATLSFVSNDNVVGQVEGLSILFGLGLAAGLDYVNGAHLWRNNLTVNQAWSRTPVVDEFVKNNDVIALESMYNYFFLSWAGAFARLALQTSLLKSQIVTAEPQDYEVVDRDGNSGVVSGVTRRQISDPFKPLTLNESIGLFAEPVQSDPVNVSLRLGFGGRQTFAKDVFVEIDNDTEPPVGDVKLQELQNVSQAGLELFAGVGGKMEEGRFTYNLGASVLIPFINNDDTDRSATELTRIGVKAGATFSVFSWMSLVFASELVSDPQLFPEGEELVQFQNSLLLAFNYTFVDRKEGLQELEAEAAAEKEKKALEEAEKKAAEAEARAAEAEAKLKAAEEAAQKAAEEKKAAEEAKEAAPEAPAPTEPTPEPAPTPTPAPNP